MTEYNASVEKLVHDTTIQDSLVAELPRYKMADGLFGCGLAKRARDKRSLGKWVDLTFLLKLFDLFIVTNL